MKSNTYTKSVLAIAALSTQQVLAQTPLGNEQGQVCGFTLSVDNNAIVRTNDWTLAVNNGDAALSQSNFWITAADIARLYGSNGNRCEFDPYLQCDDNDNDDDDDNNNNNDNDNTPFTISSTGALTFTNQTTFFLCARNAFTDFDDDGTVENTNEDNLQAYPYIYPPVGTTNNSPRNYENCTQATLVADRCFQGNSGEYNVAPSAALASSTALSSATATGTGAVSGPTGTVSVSTTLTGTTSAGASGTTATGSGSAAATATGAAAQVSVDKVVMAGIFGAAVLAFAV